MIYFVSSDQDLQVKGSWGRAEPSRKSISRPPELTYRESPFEDQLRSLQTEEDCERIHLMNGTGSGQWHETFISQKREDTEPEMDRGGTDL